MKEASINIAGVGVKVRVGLEQGTVVKRHFKSPIVARGAIFPLNAAHEPFFVKLWPAYDTVFETPGLEKLYYEKNTKTYTATP